MECDDRETRRKPGWSARPGSRVPSGSRISTSARTRTCRPALIGTLARCQWVAAWAAAGADRRFRHRQEPPADRAGHRRRRARLPGQVRHRRGAVNELAEAADDRTLTRVISRYGRIDLLRLDELGYIELDRRGAELLFEVFTEREEKNSSRSRRTPRSANGSPRSPTPGCAPRSWTGAPTTRTSSRPGGAWLRTAAARHQASGSCKETRILGHVVNPLPRQ